MADFLTVSTTTDSADSAGALARSAVAARLAACAQVEGPVTSLYWWRGTVDTAQEWRVVLKTTGERYAALEAHLRAAHPYEVPEVIAVPVVAGSPDYLAWVRAETTGH